MPTLIIDDREIEVPPGTKVIQAAEHLGIKIPRFCYHEALGSVGACRMCAVKFLRGSFKGVQMSCLIDAQDGMVVSTTDDDAVAFRKYIIELLMLNHPHDCPVCDEGGQCLLQDMTVSSGHELRRFLGRKRTYRDQNLGVFIAHEMNRCIHCYRCSRFYQEFAGYRDLGPLALADRVYFGRFRDGRLESPFAGNLVDLCPTGVYTDKPARYKGRRWDFERAPSLCLHCSLGCNTIANARYRAMVRVEARFSEPVNGYFICDRGRFGFAYANHPERPRRARVDGIEVTLGEALRTAADRLAEIQNLAGGRAVACLGSMRGSLESQGMLKQLSRRSGWREPDYFPDSGMANKVRAAVGQLDNRVAVSLRQIEAADFILAVGVDPLNEAPMLALAMRQAHRREAAVAVIDPRPVSLPLPFEHVAVPTWDLERCFGLVIEAAAPEPDGPPFRKGGQGDFLVAETDKAVPSLPVETRQQLAKLGVRLKASRSPVLICGTDVVAETTPAVVGAGARSVLRKQGECALFYVLPGPNAFGAALLSSTACSFQETLEAIERGEVKALIVVEADPLGLFPDRSRLERALSRLELLLVMDCLPSPSARQAHIFLPTPTLFETGASFINQEGRLQYAHPACHGGTPVSQVSGGGHPPRIYTGDLPGGDPKPAWQMLADLAPVLSVEVKTDSGEHPLVPASEEHPLLRPLQTMRYPVDGFRCLPEQVETAPPPEARDAASALHGEKQLQLLLVESVFGTEELAQYADVIHQIEDEPCLQMHPDEAVRLGLADGDAVILNLDGGTLETRVCLTADMARRTLVLPRHRRLDRQKATASSVLLPLNAIAKA